MNTKAKFLGRLINKFLKQGQMAMTDFFKIHMVTWMNKFGTETLCVNIMLTC
jgi:hypothetical protein